MRDSEYAYAQRQKHVYASDVGLFKLLSEPLRCALELQVYVPVISMHRVFRTLCRKEDQTAMHAVCRDALSTIAFADEDMIFGAGQSSLRMLFVVDSKLEYRKSGTQTSSS